MFTLKQKILQSTLQDFMYNLITFLLSNRLMICKEYEIFLSLNKLHRI